MSYPECDRLAAASETSDTVHEFLDWLTEQGIHLATWDEAVYIEPRLMEHNESPVALVQRFLGIDPVALERERRALLAAARAGDPR